MTIKFKPSSAITVCAAIALLSACSATTSGVSNAAKPQAKPATTTAVVNKVAPKAPEAKPTTMASVKPAATGDASLTCDQLKMEIGAADAVLAQANIDGQETGDRNIADDATGAAVRYGVAKSGAANVIGRVPFGMKMFNGALNSRSKAAKKKRLEAQKMAQNAAVRRSSLAGIYTGKGCS